MKAELIDDRARVWTVWLGADGKLRSEIDRRRLSRLQSQRLAA